MSNPAMRTRERAGFWAELGGMLTRFREVWSLLGQREKLLLRLSLVPMLLHATTQNAIPILATELARRLQVANDAGTMSSQWLTISIQFMVLIGICALAREACLLGRKRLVSAVSGRLERNLTIGLVSHLFRQPLQALSKDHVGALQGKAMRGISGFIHFIRLIFRELIPTVVAVVVAMGLAFYYRPIIGVILVLALVSTLGIVSWQLRSQRGMFAELGKSRGIMDGKIIEQLEGMEYIRAANTIKLETERIAEVADHRQEADRKLWLRSSGFDILKSLNEWVFYLVVMGVTLYMATHGMVELSNILLFLGLASNLAAPLRDLHRILDDGYETSHGLGDLMGLMDEFMDPSFADDPSQDMTLLKRFGERRPAPAKIEFKEPTVNSDVPLFATENLVVSVGQGEKRRRILDGVSVEIRMGETIGFAGPSGSGKSTLLKVLMRLLPLESGAALFGGVSIEKVSRESIGNLIGYVSQNPFVFAGTVAENIAYGCPNATPEAIQSAAEQAGIHQDILAMSGGYEAILHERGSNISGGQRQRIAIARILLKDPPILILDEGTSALDDVSEQKVQETIESLKGSRTVLMVAHRLTTLRKADRILVFERGKIVQTGTLEVLANQEGVFQNLMRVAKAE